MSKYSVKDIDDFSAGVNLSTSPDLLKNNQVRDLVNMNPILLGGVVSRWGTSVESTIAGTTVSRLIEFEFYSGGNRVLRSISVVDGVLKDITTGTSIKTGITGRVSYEVLDNKIYFLTSGMFFSYDGTTTTDVTTTDTNAENVLYKVKNCKYLEQRGDRLFAAGNPEFPNELYYSQPFEPSQWYTPDKVTASAAPMGINPIRAVSDDGDIITGLSEFHGALLVIKARHIYAWFGYDPFEDVTFKQLDVASGAISDRSICKVENGLIYLGEDGIYKLRGTYENVIVTEYLSDAVKPLIDTINIPTDYSNSNISAVYIEGMYMLSVPVGEDTDCSLILVYHSKTADAIGEPSWSYYKGLAFNEMIVGYDRKLRALQAVTNKVIHMSDEYLSDEGNKIDTILRLRPIFVESTSAFYIKKFRSIMMIIKQFEGVNSAFNITGTIDFTPIEIPNIETPTTLVWDVTNWDTSVWGFSEVVVAGGRIRGGRGKRLDLTISSSDADNKILIFKVGIEFKMKKLEKVGYSI